MIKPLPVLCFLLLAFSRLPSQAPAWLWAKDASSSGPEQAWDVACDRSTGNVYVAGSFNGNLSAYYGISLAGSTGGLDGFVAKYSATGTVLSAFKIGGANDEEIKSAAVDPYGNLYITGYFSSTTDFDPSAASFNLTPNGGSGNQDGFLAKYSSAGAFLWAIKFGDANAEMGWRVIADSNYVYLTGQYVGSSTFYSTNATTKSTIAAQAMNNMFGAKYNPSGVVQWVVSAGGTKDDISYNVIADNANVYFIGIYNQDISVYDASGTLGTTLQIQSPNKANVFITAYQQSGAYAWATNIASSSDNFGSGLTQDQGSLYVSGSFKNTASFPYPSPLFTKTSVGNTDIFLAKLSKANGIFQWVSSQTGSGGADEVGYELDYDINGHIIMSGNFLSSLNYSAFGGPTLTSSGNEDIFVDAFDNAGNILWAIKAGANGTDIPYGLCTDTAGGIFVAGQHANNTVFGAYTITTSGNTNIFVAKTGCGSITNNTATASQTICSGSTPSMLTGSSPTGGVSPYSYVWQQSANAITWTNAAGTYTGQGYSPPALTSNTYYRRQVTSGGFCNNSSNSATVLITVNTQPTVANAGSDQAICSSSTTLAANSPAAGAGTWTVLSGGGTVTSPSLPGSAVTGLSTGQNKFIWTISNGVCPASKDTVMITHDDAPTTANAGIDQTVCAATATFSANTAIIGSGAWSLASGSGTVTSPTSPASSVSSVGVGSNKFVWSVANGSCPISCDTMVIRRDAVPTTANAGADQALCTTSATLNANVPTTGNGIWTVQTGSGTLTAASSPSSAVSALSPGANQFIWTISNGVCPASRDTVSITRDAQPGNANAGSDQAICSTTATLSGNNPATGSGLWSVMTGTGNVSTPSSPGSPVNNLGSGPNAFIWTISNGSCPVSKDTVVIIRDALPSQASAGADQVTCSASGNFSAVSPSTGTGAWSLLTGTGTISSATSATSTVSNLGAGQNAFAWTISSGVCPVSQDTVVITRDLQPSTANAGADQVLCAAGTTLGANSPGIGTGTWSLAAGTASISAAASPSTAVNSLSMGNNALVWTISNGVCPDSRDTVVIKRDAEPSSAAAGADQVICGPATLLAGNNAVTGTGTWALLSGTGNVASLHLATSGVTGLGTGTNVFTWTISNGSCPPTSDTVSIRSDAQPTAANAGVDQILCSSSCTLGANVPAVGTGVWSVASGTGTFTSAGSAATSLSGLSGDDNIFVWTISNGICPSAHDSVKVHRDLPPTPAMAGNDQSICSFSTTLSGNTPSVGTGLWGVASGSGVAANSASAGTIFSGLGAGINLLAWTITNGSCPASSDTVAIHVDAPPAPANAGPDQSVCSTSVTLAAVNPNTGTGTWSIQSGAGSLSTPGLYNSMVSGLAIGTAVFRWTVSNGVCPATFDDVVVKRDTFPGPAMAGADQDLNIPAGQLSATPATIGTGSWIVLSGDAVIDDPSNPASTFRGLSTGVNVFEWRVANGSCLTNTDDVNIYLEPFKIPNAFSPNGDNINDLFVVPGLDYFDGVKFSVFNRWGGLVYDNDNYKNNWAGNNKSNEQLAEDTYYFTLDIAPHMNYSGYVILKRNK